MKRVAQPSDTKAQGADRTPGDTRIVCSTSKFLGHEGVYGSIAILEVLLGGAFASTAASTAAVQVFVLDPPFNLDALPAIVDIRRYCTTVLVRARDACSLVPVIS